MKGRKLIASIVALSMVSMYSLPMTVGATAEEIVQEDEMQVEVTESVAESEEVEIEESEDENVATEIETEDTVEGVTNATTTNESEETSTTTTPTTSDSQETTTETIQDNIEIPEDFFNDELQLFLKGDLSVIGNGIAYLANMDNVQISVNDMPVTVDEFSLGMSKSTVKMDSWMEGDTATVKISNLPKYITSVTYEGNDYIVGNGSVDVPIQAKTIIYEEFDEDKASTVTADAEGNIELVDESKYIKEGVGISMDIIQLNIDTNALYVRVYNPDGSYCSNALVEGFFREYNEDGTFIDKASTSYRADENGVICIQGSASSNDQSFVYKASSDTVYLEGETTKFNLHDSIQRIDIKLKNITKIGSINETNDKIETLQGEVQGSISNLIVKTTNKNFDDSFIMPIDLKIRLQGELSNYEYYIDDFGTMAKGSIINGNYNIEYISDTNFKLDGANVLDLSGNSPTIPVILTANYTITVRKTSGGKDIEWSIVNPRTGETITHTGEMVFAVEKNTHYFLTDEKSGETFDLIVGGNYSVATLDLGTGEITYTETAKNSGGGNIYAIPQTADLSPIAIGVSVVGVIGATGVIAYKKKRKKDDNNHQDNTNFYDEI